MISPGYARVSRAVFPRAPILAPAESDKRIQRHGIAEAMAWAISAGVAARRDTRTGRESARNALRWTAGPRFFVLDEVRFREQTQIYFI